MNLIEKTQNNLLFNRPMARVFTKKWRGIGEKLRGDRPLAFGSQGF